MKIGELRLALATCREYYFDMMDAYREEKDYYKMKDMAELVYEVQEKANSYCMLKNEEDISVKDANLGIFINSMRETLEDFLNEDTLLKYKDCENRTNALLNILNEHEKEGILPCAN